MADIEDHVVAWVASAKLFLERSWPPISNGKPFLFATDDSMAFVRTDCPIVELLVASHEASALLPQARVVGHYLPMTGS